jgi:hypothetical protein
MLVGLPVSEIIPKFGHDGSERVPENPFGRRCFYDLEAIRVAYDMGVHLVPFVRYLQISETRRDCLIDDLTFKQMLECNSGLLMGTNRLSSIGHSVTWMDRHVLDSRKPEVVTYEQFDDCTNVEVLLAWVNRPQNL